MCKKLHDYYRIKFNKPLKNKALRGYYNGCYMERKKIAFLAQKTHQQIDITVDVFNVLVLYYDKNIDTFSLCIIHEWICCVNNFFAIFISNNFESFRGFNSPFLYPLIITSSKWTRFFLYNKKKHIGIIHSTLMRG